MGRSIHTPRIMDRAFMFTTWPATTTTTDQHPTPLGRHHGPIRLYRGPLISRLLCCPQHQRHPPAPTFRKNHHRPTLLACFMDIYLRGSLQSRHGFLSSPSTNYPSCLLMCILRHPPCLHLCLPKCALTLASNRAWRTLCQTPVLLLRHLVPRVLSTTKWRCLRRTPRTTKQPRTAPTVITFVNRTRRTPRRFPRTRAEARKNTGVCRPCPNADRTRRSAINWESTPKCATTRRKHSSFSWNSTWRMFSNLTTRGTRERFSWRRRCQK